LGGLDDPDQLIAILDQERQAWADEPFLQLSYHKAGGRPGDTRDLKPRPADLRAFLAELLQAGRSRSLEAAAAAFTETAQDNNGNTKPSALHFTAGQQQWLLMVTELQREVRPEDLREALLGPWRYQRELPVLGWDSSANRDYALLASNPSKDKKTGVPGADWLAFLGLALLPCAPRRDQILTTGCAGGWKTGTFTWPLWTVPLGLEPLRSLIGRPDLDRLPPEHRARMGIGAIFTSGIRRSDQGGYGSMRPARPA
jgi:hypothetical protein